nr:hypothetical protein [Sinorhizobium meliloti]
MLIGLLASSGLRSGEVVRLDRSDVDLTNGVLLVRKTKFRKSSRSGSRRPKQRFVAMPVSAMPLFPVPRTRPFPQLSW